MVIQWEKEEIVFFKADITELMRGMYNVKDFSERSADIWYSVISSSIAYDEFVSALQKYLASALGVYPPKPANILEIALGKAKTPEEFIQEKIEEHPDPDMAWAIASRMLDERETLVITQEILNSFRMVSHMSADSIAQRKAFQSFYRKEVQQSVEQGKKPVWTISRGWDKNLWKVRIQEAVDHGFLSIEKLEDEYRMLLEHQQESKPMAKILHLIKGKSAESSTEDNEIPEKKNTDGDPETREWSAYTFSENAAFVAQHTRAMIRKAEEERQALLEKTMQERKERQARSIQATKQLLSEM